MKTARIIIKSTAIVFAILTAIIFASLFYVEKTVSNYYCVNPGETLKIEGQIPLRASYCSENAQSVNYGKTPGSTFKMDIKVLGVIPAKQISVRVVDDMYVAVLGTPFGIKLYTEGVLVVGFSEIDSSEGAVNPAKQAGLKEGDFIVSLNGQAVYTNEDVSAVIKNSQGGLIVAKVISSRTEKTVSFYPAKSVSGGVWRAGIWVKDSSAGIGTMTFYNPKYNVVAGLGHGICDSDTGTLMSLSSGEFVTAEILSSQKGRSGKAGELIGNFTGKKIADFSLNSNIGVYGQVSCDIDISSLTRVALKQEVRNGVGYILTTIKGESPTYYTCNVQVRNMDDSQNLLVEITDERLLNTTGGIVQGMSGSPIIQNGKLIGAVTHVLVDDPKKGYGIFAETMLETAEGVAEQQLKKAS